MSRFHSEVLGAHERHGFTSGNDRIDGYFRAMASQDVKRGYAACYVLVETATGTLAGFYSIAANSIPLAEVPTDLTRKLPRYPTIPAVLIGWLGRDLRYKGQDIGPMLLRDAVVRIEASKFGVYALVADAIDEAATAFYRRHQFIPFVSKPNTLFLPMATAAKAL